MYTRGCSPFTRGRSPGFVEKGLRPLQPSCSGSFPPYTRAFPPRAPPCMPRCLSSCVAVSAKQSTIIIHTSVRAEDCSRSSAGAYRSRDNLPHAITVCVRQPRSERPERMKRARKRAIQKVLRSKKQLATFSIDLFNKACSPLTRMVARTILLDAQASKGHRRLLAIQLRSLWQVSDSPDGLSLPFCWRVMESRRHECML